MTSPWYSLTLAASDPIAQAARRVATRHAAVVAAKGDQAALERATKEYIHAQRRLDDELLRVRLDVLKIADAERVSPPGKPLPRRMAPPPPGRPSEVWPVVDIVAALAQRGWGPLATDAHAGHRFLLQAVAQQLKITGAGAVSLPALADDLDASTVWVEQTLVELHALGLLTWSPGTTVPKGPPVPDYIRLNRGALCHLANHCKDPAA